MEDKLDEILDKFKIETEDLWEQFMEGDDPDPQKYDDFLANAYKEAKTALKALIDKQVAEAQLDILQWATGGIKEFTEDGDIYISKKIDELTAQLNGAKDE